MAYKFSTDVRLNWGIQNLMNIQTTVYLHPQQTQLYPQHHSNVLEQPNTKPNGYLKNFT